MTITAIIISLGADKLTCIWPCNEKGIFLYLKNGPIGDTYFSDCTTKHMLPHKSPHKRYVFMKKSSSNQKSFHGKT